LEYGDLSPFSFKIPRSMRILRAGEFSIGRTESGNELQQSKKGLLASFSRTVGGWRRPP